MAKRYYWLKLPDDFFRQKPIKKLRRIAGGDTYTVIYLKMLLVAIKQDCRLYFDGVEEDFCTELALDLDEDLDNVKVTVSFLLSQGLMVKDEEAEYLLTECDKMVGSETAGAQRVRDYRNRKALHCNTDVTPVLRDCNVEKEIDTRVREDTRDREESESEKEKREEIEIREDKDTPAHKAQRTKDANALFEYLWDLYPKKRGKGSVSLTQKKKLLKIGKEPMEQAIRNYMHDIEINGTDMKYVKNGSSFFNSGYVDYLPENYVSYPTARTGNRYQSTAEYMEATKGWSDGITDDDNS